MKKCWIFLVALFLTGCAAEETFETVADEQLVPVYAQAREIFVELPEEAAAPAVESGSGRLYLCRDYEISIQTMTSGDLDSTIRQVCGYGREDLTVMETEKDGIPCYSFAWACAGENGDRVGRAMVLEDGAYHYVLTVLTDAASAKENQAQWQRMFETFSLAEGEG